MEKIKKAFITIIAILLASIIFLFTNPVYSYGNYYLRVPMGISNDRANEALSKISSVSTWDKELEQARKCLLQAEKAGSSGNENDAKMFIGFAFDRIERAVSLETSKRTRVNATLRLLPYELLLTAPCRLDLASGLGSDLFAVSMLEGGQVLNAAITLNGNKPIRINIKPIKDYEIRITSVDSGHRETIAYLSQLTSTKTKDPLGLYKMALVEAGIIPEHSGNLEQILKALGGGLSIEGEVVGIPRGSGLGVSSILAATLVKGLFEITDRPLSDSELLMHVINIEQRMHSLGGWQDPVGGAFGGIKWIEAKAGNPIPTYEKLSLPDHVIEELKSRLFLVYSGEPHFAGDPLAQIITGYLLKQPQRLDAMREAQKARDKMYNALLKGDLDEFGLAMRKYWPAMIQMHGPLATNQVIDNIFRIADPLITGGKVSGAGGGFIFLLAKKDKKKDLKDLIEAQLKGTGAMLYNWDIDNEGIEVTRVPTTDRRYSPELPTVIPHIPYVGTRTAL